MSSSNAKFKININEGIIEIEGNQLFVDKHLERLEGILKEAVHQAMLTRVNQNELAKNSYIPSQQDGIEDDKNSNRTSMKVPSKLSSVKHQSKASPTVFPIPVDLKANEGKVGLREFYSQKMPLNHYEKTAVFVYYLTKFNNQTEIKFGEIMSCYEEVNEKKPSITDIVKNSIRYKGWLEQGTNKFSTRLTVSGENFVKFDLPQKKYSDVNISTSS
ncbi:MAG TPA: hypothetical protein VE593_12960 [Nitrososphaeraceae archaeon]|nr:hypothetical protein [Nitrososphaeraceae archaeon]